MVYTKRIVKRRPTRKVTWYNKRRSFSVESLANQIHKIKEMINCEKKFYTVGNAFSAPSAGSIQPLVSIAQGDLNTQRNGNSILVHSISSKIHFTKGTNSAANNTMLRLILIQDIQQRSDTTPTISDLLESDWQSGLKKENVGRYKVIWNQVIPLTATIKEQGFIQKYWKLSQHVRYNGPNASDIQKNGFYLIAISNMADVAGTRPEVSHNTVLSFYDN